jgi:hypothetical protein
MYNKDQHSESARDEGIKSSYRLRLRTRIGIVFLLLIAVLTLTSLPALSKDKPRAPQKARAIKGTKDDTKKASRGSVRKVESNRAQKEIVRSIQKSLDLYK